MRIVMRARTRSRAPLQQAIVLFKTYCSMKLKQKSVLKYLFQCALSSPPGCSKLVSPMSTHAAATRPQAGRGGYFQAALEVTITPCPLAIRIEVARSAIGLFFSRIIVVPFCLFLVTQSGVTASDKYVVLAPMTFLVVGVLALVVPHRFIQRRAIVFGQGLNPIARNRRTLAKPCGKFGGGRETLIDGTCTMCSSAALSMAIVKAEVASLVIVPCPACRF